MRDEIKKALLGDEKDSKAKYLLALSKIAKIGQTDGIGFGNIKESDIHKIMKDKNLALFGVLKGMEKSEELGDLVASVRSNLERMEERLWAKLKEDEVQKQVDEKNKELEEAKKRRARERAEKRRERLRKLKEKFKKFKEKVKNSKFGKKVKAFKDKVFNWLDDKVFSRFRRKSKIVTKEAMEVGAKKAGKKVVAKEAMEVGAKKTASKAVTKTTSKVVQKAAAKTATKTAAKIGGKAAFKSVIKKIPVVSAVAGVAFGVERCFKGQWKEAGGEVLSGVLGCLPGVGTAASVAVDVGLAANDIANETKKIKEGIEVAQTVKKVMDSKVGKEVVDAIAQRGEDLRLGENGAKKDKNPKIKERKLNVKDMVELKENRRA